MFIMFSYINHPSEQDIEQSECHADLFPRTPPLTHTHVPSLKYEFADERLSSPRVTKIKPHSSPNCRARSGFMPPIKGGPFEA